MAEKIPLLTTSHTVRGTQTFEVTADSAGSGLPITVPEGEWWVDPHAAIGDANNGNNLIVKVGALIEDQVTPGTCSGTYVTTSLTRTGFYRSRWETVDDSFMFQGHLSPTNLAYLNARAILRRLGINQLDEDPAAVSDDFMSTLDPILGTWSPSHGEGLDIDEREESGGITNRSYGKSAYAFGLGEPLKNRILTFNRLPAALVWARASGDYDYSFERHIKDFALRGEKIRFYANRSATITYLTAAMTISSASASVGSGTGIANGEWIYIDGERCKVISGGGTGTLALFRPWAEAHAAYAPVSDDFVATYVLDNDGGGVSMGEWDPERAAPHQDFFDISIALVRSAS